MLEVEAKILEIDRQKTAKKLEKLGAKKTFEGSINAIFYDFPDNGLEAQNKILRLRSKGKNAELTFKERVSSKKAKVAKETEVSVSNFGLLKKILKSIGLEEKRVQNKHRISYKLGRMHFEIDSFPCIPAFLEIEAESVKELEKGIKLLGFKAGDAKAWTCSQVLKHYKKQGKT